MQLVKGKNGRSDETSARNGKVGDVSARDAAGRNGIAIKALDKAYRPSEREPFMNDRQREYFRAKLLDWREDILKEAKETLQHLQDDNQNHPDLADRASSETDRAIELRARDRQRKLIAKIDAALQRIEDGTYGYCEETGEPISLKRLEARPIATLSIEAQERHERRERVYRDE
jgi:DnaK suppressor protein